MMYYYYKHENEIFVNCMDMPWVQQLSHTQSENCRSSLCAIYCVPIGSNSFHKVKNCRIVYSWVQSLAQSENRAAATHFVLDCVYPAGVKSFAHEWNHSHKVVHIVHYCVHIARCTHLVNPIMQDAGEQQHIVVVVI